MKTKTALQTFIEWGDKMMKEQPMKVLSFADAIDKAEELLALEKEQIMKAWMATDNELQRISAEHYYNETYNSKQ